MRNSATDRYAKKYAKNYANILKLYPNREKHIIC